MDKQLRIYTESFFWKIIYLWKASMQNQTLKFKKITF